MMEKNSPQNMQQTLRFFEKQLCASADGIVITDPAKNIIFVNDTFCKFFSRTKQDVIETNIFVWLAKLGPNAKDIWKGMEIQIKENGIAKDVEFMMKYG
jgi:PAS domain S-box-containing protein